MAEPLARRPSRFVPLLALALLVPPLAAAGSYSAAAPTAKPTPLTVLLHFDAATKRAFRHLGIAHGDVGRAIGGDLRRELGQKSGIRVEPSPLDFERAAAAGAERAATAHGLRSLAQTAERLEREAVARGEAPGNEVAQAEAAIDGALRRVEQELAKRRNLARLPCGTIGINFQGTDAYGGRAFPGERWATVYTGALPTAFPAPEALKEGRLVGLDFSVPAFDPYREGYSAARRRAYAIRSLANAVKKELGASFGLPANARDLRDAMRGAISLQAAEHFTRDAQPTRFGPSDRARLRASVARTLASCRRQPGARALSTREQFTPARALELVRKHWDAIEKATGVVSSVADILVTVADAVQPAGKVEITNWPVPALSTDLELGLTMKIPYEVRFQFAESALRDSGEILAQLYVLLDGKVFHWEYYFLPDDDDHDFRVQGSLYLGAHSWPCANVTDDLTFIAMLHHRKAIKFVGFSEQAQDYRRRLERQRRNDPSIDVVGWYATGQTFSGFTQIQGAEIDKQERKLQITVINPYYVQTKSSDAGKTKLHGESFDLDFDAVMQYQLNYPQFQVFDPAPPNVDVALNGLASKEDWAFAPQPPAKVQFQAGKGKLQTRNVTQTGSHGGAGHAEPVTYEDDYGAGVSGKGQSFKIDASGSKPRTVPAPYDFSALFRRDPQSLDCTPIRYQATDEQPT